jgi:hypothetical protein
MPLTTLSCPGCKINLRPNKPVPPGKKVKCPKCATIFVTGNGTPDPASGIQTKPRPQAPPPLKQEEEDQGWEIVDEEPGKVIEAFKVVDPVAKAPQIDYENEPKAKDKAKPKPAAKPVPRHKDRYEDEDEEDEDDYRDDEDQDEEDEDEVDEEEDEEDERPRPKARRKTRNDSSKVLLIVLLLVGGGFVLLAGAGGAGYYWYVNRHKNSGTGNEDPLAYLPSDANTIVGFDMGALLSQPAIASQIQQAMRRNNSNFLSDCKRNTGLEFNELFDHVVIAARASPQQPVGGGQSTGTIIIRSKVPFDVNKVRDSFKEPTAERVKGKTYFKVKDPDIKAVFMPSNRILILTDAPDATVQQMVGSDGSTPKISTDALSMIRDLEKGSAGWVVVPFEGEVKSSIQMNANAAPPEFRGLTQAVALAKCLGASFAISGGSAAAQVKLHCTDEKTAKQLASQVQTLWDTQLKGVGGVQIMTMLNLVPKEVKTFLKELIDSTKFTSQGSMAQANAQVSVASLQAAIVQFQNMATQGGGFPGMPAPGGRRGFRP